jgi:hypothetical protein
VFVLVFVLCDRNEYANGLVPAFAELKIRYFGHDGVVLHSRDIRKAIGDFSFLQVPEKRESFKSVEFDLKFVSKKANVLGHQLADLCAYPIARRVIDPKKSHAAFQIVQTKFVNRPGWQHGFRPGRACAGGTSPSSRSRASRDIPFRTHTREGGAGSRGGRRGQEMRGAERRLPGGRYAGFQPARVPRECGRQDAGVAASRMPALRGAGVSCALRPAP